MLRAENQADELLLLVKFDKLAIYYIVIYKFKEILEQNYLDIYFDIIGKIRRTCESQGAI